MKKLPISCEQYDLTILPKVLQDYLINAEDHYSITDYNFNQLYNANQIYLDQKLEGALPWQLMVKELRTRYPYGLGTTPRQCGKSAEIAMNANDKCRFNDRHKHLVVAPTHKQAREAGLSKIMDWWNYDDRGNEIKHIYEKDGQVRYTNGNRALFTGCDTPDNVRGFGGFKSGDIDEFEFLKKDAFAKVIQPVFSFYGAPYTLWSTPRTIHGPFYEMFDYAGRKKDWWRLHLPPHLALVKDLKSIADRCEVFDLEVILNEDLAIFTEFGNRVYPNYTNENLITPDNPHWEWLFALGYDPKIPAHTDSWWNMVKGLTYQTVDNSIHSGWDFNSGKGQEMSSNHWWDFGEKVGLICFDETIGAGWGTEQMVHEQVKKFKDRGYNNICYPDASADFAGGANMHMVQKEFKTRVDSANGKHVDNIQIVRRNVCSVTGTRRVGVAMHCKKTDVMFRKYSYLENTNTGQLDRKSGFDHMGDVTEYAFRKLRNKTEFQDGGDVGFVNI